MSHDFTRPLISVAEMEDYFAVHDEIAVRHGRLVKAIAMSNREYCARHAQLSAHHTMVAPSGCMKIYHGYLVVRNVGTAEQFETWIPDDAFAAMYARAEPAPTP
jgi:hypothetical protein